MIICIPSILKEEELETIKTFLSKAEFVDGKITAGWHAKLVKNNQQLDNKNSDKREMEGIVIKALNRNPLFQTAVRPKFIHSILFSRYEVGMSYGRHVDNAIMKDGRRVDVSFTLFLNSPDEYEGGELVMEGAQDEQDYCLEAGSAIVYPSTTLHRVEPVTKGVRLAAVGWVQSFIREAGDREILFDLDTARRVMFAQQGKSAEFDLISKSIANLIRKWADR